jgi:uncharacterized protein YjbJ (UPF0337 family)
VGLLAERRTRLGLVGGDRFVGNGPYLTVGPMSHCVRITSMWTPDRRNNYRIATLPTLPVLLSICVDGKQQSGTRVATQPPSCLRGAHSSSNEELRMNWDRVEGNWKQMTGKVKQQWGKLTDDTLTEINGQRDQLVGKIQEAYGISRDEADRQVQEWEKLN